MSNVKALSQMCRMQLSGERDHDDRVAEEVQALVRTRPDLMHKQLDFVMWISEMYEGETSLSVPISDIPERFLDEQFYYLGWYILQCAEAGGNVEYRVDNLRGLLFSREVAEDKPPWDRRGGIDPSIN